MGCAFSVFDPRLNFVFRYDVVFLDAAERRIDSNILDAVVVIVGILDAVVQFCPPLTRCQGLVVRRRRNGRHSRRKGRRYFACLFSLLQVTPQHHSLRNLVLKLFLISSVIVHVPDASKRRNVTVASTNFSVVQRVHWRCQFLSGTCESCPRAFDKVLTLNLGGISESGELSEIFDFLFKLQDFDAHPLYCHCVVFSGFRGRVGDEVCFVVCNCTPCGVVASM